MSPSIEVRERYREFCRQAHVPLFAQDWWLDAVAGPGGWGVALVERGGEVHAALPYALGRRRRLPVICMPPLTRSLGPWFRDVGGSEAARLSREYELTGELVAALPRVARFELNFHPGIGNWLPWYWRGYSQETRYTYVVPAGMCEDKLLAGLDGNTRNALRKAQDRCGLRVSETGNLGDFLRLHRAVYERQERVAPVDDELLRRVDAACAANDARRVTLAHDAEGRIHAAVYVVHDAATSYYLMSGSDPALRSSSALTLLLWQAMVEASRAGRAFDFEGSMNPSLEPFIRRFGGRQTPYSAVWRTHSRFLAWADLLRDGPGRRS